MVNLFMAVVWLIVAAGVFGQHWLHPGERDGVSWGSNVYIGWVAIVFALYNVVRWWSARSYARHRQIAGEEWARRKPRESRGRLQAPGAPDPTFNFTDEPQRTEPS